MGARYLLSQLEPPLLDSSKPVYLYRMKTDGGGSLCTQSHSMLMPKLLEFEGHLHTDLLAIGGSKLVNVL